MRPRPFQVFAFSHFFSKSCSVCVHRQENETHAIFLTVAVATTSSVRNLTIQKAKGFDSKDFLIVLISDIFCVEIELFVADSHSLKRKDYFRLNDTNLFSFRITQVLSFYWFSLYQACYLKTQLLPQFYENEEMVNLSTHHLVQLNGYSLQALVLQIFKPLF